MNQASSTGAGDLNRRQFVKWAAATGVMASVAPHVWAQEKKGDMIYRTLGKTGERVSALGLGGYHIGAIDESLSLRIIRSAIDRGITFMDNAWDYNDGRSEVFMGRALRDGYREKVFLMTKFDGRTAAKAAEQIDQSLQRLQTDHVDLIQFHENIRLEDPDRFFAPDGAVEAVVAARKAGKVRYIGFTGHKDPCVHLRMLEMAAKRRFHFNTVQMPINVMDAHFRSFTHQVVPVALEQGVAVLGMKSMGSGVILSSKTVTPLECLHFALSQPTSVVITGINTMEILDQAFEAARTFQPMTEAQMARILSRTADDAKQGRYELFKTTTVFDSTAQHPEWMG